MFSVSSLTHDRFLLLTVRALTGRNTKHTLSALRTSVTVTWQNRPVAWIQQASPYFLGIRSDTGCTRQETCQKHTQTSICDDTLHVLPKQSIVLLRRSKLQLLAHFFWVAHQSLACNSLLGSWQPLLYEQNVTHICFRTCMNISELRSIKQMVVTALKSDWMSLVWCHCNIW